MPSNYLNIGFEGILNIYNLLRIFSNNLFISDICRCKILETIDK